PVVSRPSGRSRDSCARRWPPCIPSWRTAIRRPPARRPLTVGVVVWALIALVVPHATQAQGTGEPPSDSSGVFLCSKPSVPQTSNPVVRDILTEFRDLTYDFCRVTEDYKEGGWSGMLDRQFGTVQDAIVDVFVGHGLHPAIGTIVPESGVAFGLALNNEWHIT